MRVLVVEDEPELRRSIADGLRAAGLAVDVAPDIAGADERMAVTAYDCVVLDRLLPDGEGATYLAVRRAGGDATPVLLLTALSDVDDRLRGFDAGADDYLAKPFALAELVARVRSLGRRAGYVRPATLRAGDVEVDTARHEMRRAGVLLSVTPKEYAVLELLVARTGTVVSRAELIEACWDEYADPMSNVVDVVVASLRRKLGEPPVIATVRGAGYRVDV